jgi:putative transposase
VHSQTEQQIIGILTEHDAGVSVADECRKNGVSDAGIMAGQVCRAGVSKAKRLKTLEDENARLTRLLADAMLDNAALKYSRERSGDARGKAESCRPFRGRLWNERMHIQAGCPRSKARKRRQAPCGASQNAR